jgi:hypothetical protein
VGGGPWGSGISSNVGFLPINESHSQTFLQVLLEKGHNEWFLIKKISEVRKKLDKMFKDLAIFSKLS